MNSGSPVLLPWRDEAAAVLLTYFGGQEYGNAVGRRPFWREGARRTAADHLAGKEEDVPVLNVTPVDGVVTYDEGIHIGYRAWLRNGAAPAYPFGYGLGYTDWTFADATATGFDGRHCHHHHHRVTNVGSRAGKHVIQIYAERLDSHVDRPVRWLVGFRVIRAAAGETVDVSIPVTRRSLAYWDADWTFEPGDYVLRVGSSVLDLPETLVVTL